MIPATPALPPGFYFAAVPPHSPPPLPDDPPPRRGPAGVHSLVPLHRIREGGTRLRPAPSLGRRHAPRAPRDSLPAPLAPDPPRGFGRRGAGLLRGRLSGGPAESARGSLHPRDLRRSGPGGHRRGHRRVGDGGERLGHPSPRRLRRRR